MDLLFQNNIKGGNVESFKKKVIEISDELSINPNWLMAVMNSESGLDSNSVNPYSGAIGLIQFLPRTADSLNITKYELAEMSNVQQLEYVRRYLLPYKPYIDSYSDLYLTVFYPNADGVFAGTLSKPDEWQFPERVYENNKNIDVTNDNKLTIYDFKIWAMKNIPSSWIEQFGEKGDSVFFCPENARRDWIRNIDIHGIEQII